MTDFSRLNHLPVEVKELIVTGQALIDDSEKTLKDRYCNFDLTSKRQLKGDCKKVEKECFKYAIAQVNTVSIPDVMKRKAKIEEAINNEILNKELDLFVLVITDIVNSNSEAIVLGKRSYAIAKEFEIKDNVAVMPGVVSRKKQVLPLVEKNI